MPAEDAAHPLYVAALRIAQWAYCDSMVKLDSRKLRERLSDDADVSGYLPDETQCMEFVCGDDSGAPPAKLVADFPATHAYLEEFWQ